MVDALVSDEPLSLGSEMGGRTSVPPGLALPHGYPAAIPRPPSTQSQSRFGQIIPALPKVPPPGLTQGTLTPDQSPKKSTISTADAKKNIKSLANESGLAKEISTQAQAGAAKASVLPEEDFPSLDSLKNIKSRPATPTPKATPKAKRKAEKIVDKLMEKMGSSEEIKPAQTVKEEATKPAPIDTKTAKPPAPSTEESSASSEKSPGESSPAFPPLPPPSASTISFANRPAPKTLRVLPTPKTEAPPPASPALTMVSMAPSVASRAMSISYRPDTPVSEMVSDTASVISASVTHSRASSPPPSKVGSAAVRSTTKSQQRKARKDQLKQDTKLIAEVLKPEPEEHAPIMGRKKKQKKEKPAKATSSQSQSVEASEESAKVEVSVEKLEKEKPKEKEIEEKPVKSKAIQQKKTAKGKGKEKEKELEKEKVQKEEVAPTPTPPPPPPKEPVPIETQEPAEKPQPGPASVFTEIRKALWTAHIEKLNLLKPVTGNSSRLDHSHANSAARANGHCKDCPSKCGEIQDEDLAALRAGKPVRKQFHIDGSRMLITPNGDCIRGLTVDEEDDFLDLQAAIAASAEHPGAFVAPRHQPGSGAFSLIKGRAVPNGRPNIFPATAQPQSQDPIGKLQREDALSYINQYVLPRLNLGATNMGFPKGSSPTKDAAAASLNSLAPYFYGPDAAAGVGIYSPPDGARGMQDFGATNMQGEDGAKNVGMGVGGMPLMSVEDAESALGAARRETDKLEKGLNQVIKRNRRLIIGNAH